MGGGREERKGRGRKVGSLGEFEIYIILLYPDQRRPCVAMTPWLTPHFN